MKINSELKCKNINFKNRLIMPPMATAKADELGHVTREILDYYHEKTRDKIFSAVIIEHSFVDPKGRAHKNQTSIASDSDISGLSKLAKIIKNNGSLAVAQISHAGSSARRADILDTPIAPSEVINPSIKNGDMPRELTISEIKSIVIKFIDSAIRAKEAGFDGVEIHSAHGYLLNQFLSPLTNKRCDEYGGKIENRIKIHLEIIKGIREKLGENYPIFLRMGAGDFIEGGLTTSDSVYAAKEFEKAGVDVIDISGGMCLFVISDDRVGYFDVLSKPIYDNVNIPVILTGGVKHGKDVAELLDRGVCDLVGIGRSVFRDSNWIKKEIKPFI